MMNLAVVAESRVKVGPNEITPWFVPAEPCSAGLRIGKKMELSCRHGMGSPELGNNQTQLVMIHQSVCLNYLVATRTRDLKSL